MNTENPVSPLAEGVLSGRRRALARAITLIESANPAQRIRANELISELMAHSGGALRVAISGVPGAGKSTFIEALGLLLVAKGKRVAVLTIDPSSKISGGSILGDKVRMEQLSREKNAFIRPSPSSGSLGGVTRRTRESMLLCEAAGYDVVLIETVGVGQSEVTASEMVDFFLVLMLPNAGDEIQGIKKGIIEMADALVINKADGEARQAAQTTRNYYENALRFSLPKYRDRQAPVLLASALENEGIQEVWDTVLAHRHFLEERNLLVTLRAEQTRAWFHSTLHDDLLGRLYNHPGVKTRMQTLLDEMDHRAKSPHQCAEELVAYFLSTARDH